MPAKIAIVLLTLFCNGCQIVRFIERKNILPCNALTVGKKLTQERKERFLGSYFERAIVDTLKIINVEIQESYPIAGEYIQGITIEDDRIYLYANWFTNKPPQRTLTHEYLHGVWFRILTPDQRKEWEEQWEHVIQEMQKRYPEFMLYNLPKSNDAMESWAYVGAAIIFGDRDLDPEEIPSDVREQFRGILHDEFLNVGANPVNPSGQD